LATELKGLDMPHSTPTNFPDDLKPSDRLGSKSAKAISDSIKSSSNTNTSSGFVTNSGSAGNTVGVNARSLQKPIWAVLTLRTFLKFDQRHWGPFGESSVKMHEDSSPLVPAMFQCKSSFFSEYNGGPTGTETNHPLTVDAYSWYEVHENFALGRGYQGQDKRDGQVMVKSHIFPLQNPYYFNRCAIASRPNKDTNQGSVRRNPAYCINNNRHTINEFADNIGTRRISTTVDIGSFVKLWYGSGDYMLFTCSCFRGLSEYGSPERGEPPYLPGVDHPN
jgi:hypothetical protein